MARHRSGSQAPRTGSWPAALDAPATGPRPWTGSPAGTGGGRHRGDPATTPLDLAAIARAAAKARGGSTTDRIAADRTADVQRPHGASLTTTGVPGPATAPPTIVHPTTVHPTNGRPTTTRPPTAPAGHRAARPRVLTPTRAAGALALFGALAGASVAAASTGPAFLADPPADTGELARPDVLAVAPAGVSEAVAPAIVPHTTTATPTPAPTTTTTPTAKTPTVRDDGGRTLWSADFRTAGIGNFKSTPWNNQGATSPTVSGGQLNFLMPGGGKRSEVEPDFKNLSDGDEYYFGFSVRLAPDFPVNTSDWQVITQFKNDGTGTPPLELKVQDGKFLIDGDGGGFSKEIGTATPGQWTHLVLKVKFSADDGTVSAWQDGVAKFTDYAPPSGTKYAGKDSYVKTGIYRDTSIDQAGKLSFGSWAIGTSLGSVSKDLPAGTD